MPRRAAEVLSLSMARYTCTKSTCNILQQHTSMLPVYSVQSKQIAAVTGPRLPERPAWGRGGGIRIETITSYDAPNQQRVSRTVPVPAGANAEPHNYTARSPAPACARPLASQSVRRGLAVRVVHSLRTRAARPATMPSTTDMHFGDAAGGALGRVLRENFTPVFRPQGYVSVTVRDDTGDAKDGVDHHRRVVTMPAHFRELGPLIRDMRVHDDDVWVVSFPKTGTTWTQEMVWLIGHDLDYEGAKVNLPARFPFIDHTALFDYRTMDIPMPDLPEFVTDSVGFIDRLAGPRFIKTHLPYQLLPTQLQDPKSKAKMVYVCRNAKDTCVSYYHHCRLLEGYTGDFHDFCELFLAGAVCFGPFWDHVLDFWARRDQPNVLFLTYEQLKQDLAGVIRRTAAFLGKQMTDEQVEQLRQHLSFESMKNNPAVNYEEVIEINRKYNLITEAGSFMRSGTVGNWKGLMSPEQSLRFDKWSQEHLAGTGLQL